MLAFLGSATTAMVALLAALLGVASAVHTDLRGGKQVEFHRELPEGGSWGVQFQLLDGTIGFRLESPDGVIFEGPAETHGSYALTAKSSGRHAFKFVNTDPAGTPAKKISFTILGSAGESAKKLDPTLKELEELNKALRMVRDEHSFLMEREKKHREGTGSGIVRDIVVVALSTNSRVMWWFASQIAMLGGVCYFQITQLKKFFEQRRVV